MVMEYVSGGELFDYIVKKGKVCSMNNDEYVKDDLIVVNGSGSTTVLSTDYFGC